MSKTSMRFKFILLILVSTCCVGSNIFAQTGELMGSDICADGLQSTNIGIAGADPQKYYALYRNNELYQVRQSGIAGKDQMLNFGIFKEVGAYTAVAFDDVQAGFPAKQGTALKGKITISPVPVIFMGDTLKIKSGELLTYLPRADLSGTTFTWTTNVKSGKVSGVSKKGNNAINDAIQLLSGGKACIIYSITPYSPGQFSNCSGESRDLIVVVSP